MSDNPVIKDNDLILKAASHATTGSVNGTGIAAGPSGLVKAVINVTVVDTSGTLDAHLEESSDDSSYTDIPNTTFTQITAIGVYELTTRITKKYVRLVYTVGTADITFESFLTTIEK